MVTLVTTTLPLDGDEEGAMAWVALWAERWPGIAVETLALVVPVVVGESGGTVDIATAFVERAGLFRGEDGLLAEPSSVHTLGVS